MTAPVFFVQQVLRIPMGCQRLPVQAVSTRASGHWYAFAIHPGCTKWYSEADLLALNPVPVPGPTVFPTLPPYSIGVRFAAYSMSRAIRVSSYER